MSAEDQSEQTEEAVMTGPLWDTGRMGWHEFLDTNFSIDPIVKEAEIPNFERWLFLNGFRDPDKGHDAFDFSAYKTTKGETMLGLPPNTNVYAPLPGKIRRSSFWLHAQQKKTDWDLYQATVAIAHNARDTLATEVCHVIPCVKPGDYVRQGQKIGVVHSSPGEIEGMLTHVHVSMEELYPGSAKAMTPGPIDPLRVFLRKGIVNAGIKLERLELPHTGAFLQEELSAHGITTRYQRLAYHILTGGPIHRMEFE